LDYLTKVGRKIGQFHSHLEPTTSDFKIALRSRSAMVNPRSDIKAMSSV
jgi:hypothetical protein